LPQFAPFQEAFQRQFFDFIGGQLPGLQGLIGELQGITRPGISSLQNIFNLLQPIAQTGLPTTTGEAFQRSRDIMRREQQEQLAGLKELYGGSGLRYGTDLAREASRLAERTTQNISSLLANLTLGSEEAARQRQLQAGGILGQIGQMMGVLPIQEAGLRSSLLSSLLGMGGQLAGFPFGGTQAFGTTTARMGK
jgi:hypothetical protein